MNVLLTTKFVAELCKYVGIENVVYLTLLALTSFFSGFLNIWIIGSSYVHYLIYMGTYYQRSRVNYGLFLRDAVVYKLCALSNLGFLIYTHVEFTHLNLAAGLIAAGVFLASTSSIALGVERTYFGSECGWHAPKWITAFPYNIGIPHPMVMLSVWFV